MYIFYSFIIFKSYVSYVMLNVIANKITLVILQYTYLSKDTFIEINGAKT